MRKKKLLAACIVTSVSVASMPLSALATEANEPVSQSIQSCEETAPDLEQILPVENISLTAYDAACGSEVPETQEEAEVLNTAEEKDETTDSENSSDKKDSESSDSTDSKTTGEEEDSSDEGKDPADNTGDTSSDDSDKDDDISDEEEADSDEKEDPEEQLRFEACQKLTHISGKESEQEYTVDYHGDETSNGNPIFNFLSDKGISVKTVSIRQTGDYKGTLSVSTKTDDEEPVVNTVSYDEEKEGYVFEIPEDMIFDSLMISKGEEEEEALTEASVSLTATISAEGAEDIVKMQIMASDGSEEPMEALLETEVNKITSSPVSIALSSTDAKYLDSVTAEISNMVLEGYGVTGTYTVKLDLPEGLFIDSLSMPEFDGASYKLYCDGAELLVTDESGNVYISKANPEIIMEITPEHYGYEQTKNLTVSARVITNAETSLTIGVEHSATYGTEKTAEFDRVETALGVHKAEEEEPEKPDTPVPENPDPVNPVPDKPSQEKPAPADPIPATPDKESPVQDPVKEPVKPKPIRDYSGLNLIGSHQNVTEESQNAAVSYTTSSNNESYIVGNSSRLKIQTDSIYTYTDLTEEGQSSSEESEGAAADETAEGSSSLVSEETELSETIAQEIEKTEGEKTMEKVVEAKNDLKDNGFVMVGSILAVLTAICAVICAVLFGKKKDKKTDKK